MISDKNPVTIDKSNLCCPKCGTRDPFLQLDHFVDGDKKYRSRVLCYSCVDKFGYITAGEWFLSDKKAMAGWVNSAIGVDSPVGPMTDAKINNIIYVEDRILDGVIEVCQGKFEKLMKEEIIESFKVDSVSISKSPGSKAKIHADISFMPKVCLDHMRHEIKIDKDEN